MPAYVGWRSFGNQALTRLRYVHYLLSPALPCLGRDKDILVCSPCFANYLKELGDFIKICFLEIDGREGKGFILKTMTVLCLRAACYC